MIARTDRLLLRQLQPDDIDTVWLLFSDPQIVPTTIHAFTRDRCIQWIARLQEMYAKRGFAPWGVELASTHKLIGYCGLDIEHIDGTPEVEIGYRLLPSFWGQGLATEAAIAALRYAFGPLKLQRIIATVLARNPASLRVVEKSGMRYERNVLLHGQPLRLYAANARDWTEPAGVTAATRGGP
jgi:RimJ/RimL family protein N-acetyltransferase